MSLLGYGHCIHVQSLLSTNALLSFQFKLYSFTDKQFPEVELLSNFPLKGFEIMSLSPTFGQCNHPEMTSIPLK